MPNCEGRFHLYSDTSKFAAGSTLYQIQNGKPKLIAHTSKTLPEAVRSSSMTELELCGLAINIAIFLHLLTLSAPHVSIFSFSHLVNKVPLQELFSAQSLV